MKAAPTRRKWSLYAPHKTLVEKLDQEHNARTDWDVCPVVLLYRDALELHLKALVGEGSGFLRSRTDPISLSPTRSLRWLAQIVCQIIRTVGWESDFTCEGVSSLADFSALIDEVESFNPVTRAIRAARAKDPNSVSQYYRTFNVVEFAKKMDGLLHLSVCKRAALSVSASSCTCNSWRRVDSLVILRSSSRNDAKVTVRARSYRSR